MDRPESDLACTLQKDCAWIHRLARSLVRDEHLAADIAQDALVVGMSRTVPADSGTTARSWLSGIARRLAAREARRRHEREVRDRLAARCEADDVERRAEERLRLCEQLTRAVRELPEPYRTAVALRFFDGLPPRTIAQRRGHSTAAVRQHVHRGLCMLRARLDESFGERSAWLAAFVSFRLGERPPFGLPAATLAAVIVAAAAVAAVFGTAWLALRSGGAAPPADEPPVLRDFDPLAGSPARSLLAQGPQSGPQDPERLRARAAQYLEALTRMQAFAGNVLIARGGEILVQSSHGRADIAAGVANEAGTRFKLMSTSKPITAVALMRLVQQGRVALADPVGKHVEPWPASWSAVTVHDLLDHTSGIPNLEVPWGNAQEQAKARGLAAWPRFVEQLAVQPLMSEPGQQSRYSNFNFEMAGLVLESASRRTFREFVKAEVLERADMRATGFDDGSRAPGLALGYFRGRGGEPSASQQDMSRIQAAGGFWSTVGDLYRFDRALRGDAVLDAATRTAMLTPRRGTYACGFDTRPVHGHRCIQHSGGANGYVADFLRFPDDDACIVVLSNYAFAPITRISDDLARILFGIDVAMPEPVAAERLDAHAGLYGNDDGLRLLVRRSGGSLLGFEIWPGIERVGGNLLLPLAAQRFAAASGQGEYVFAEGRVATPQGPLPRIDAAAAAWRGLAGRYRTQPALGESVEIVEQDGRLLLRVKGGWPTEVEIVPAGDDTAIGLVMEDFGTLLRREGDRLRWTRADGATFAFDRLR